MRVRPTAHLADKAYIAKFNKAMEIMRSLPEDDPRSFKQQANVHCAYCDGAYDQAGFPNLELQVHDSWLFFPFHRYYLYFFERILGKLIDDPTFAMPFWNYDSPGGMRIPAMYANPNSPLYDSLRDKGHQPPAVIDLNFSNSGSSISPEQQMTRNLTTMYRQMVSNSKTPRLFFGSPYRRGDYPNPGSGSIENIPHGLVHVWTGDSTQPNFEDMGNFYSAGRDPIFYAHHSNIDRKWSLWKGLGGRREDIKDPDFLDAAFLFYDENGHMVRVKVRDCLDNTKLGYVYQDVEIPWLESRPKPRISSVVRKLKKLVKANAADTTAHRSPREVLPAKLDKVLKVMVKRPKKKRSKKEKDELEEILIIQGIELDRDVYAKFDVYINDEDDEVSTEENTEFAGSFVNVPHKHKHGKKIKTQLRLSITDLLEDLDAEDDEHVLVTLVPTSAGDSVKIHDHPQLRLQHLWTELDHPQPRLQHLWTELDHPQPRLQHLWTELDHPQPRLQHLRTELDHPQPRLQHLSTEPDRPGFHLNIDPDLPGFHLSTEAGLPPIPGLHLSTEADLPPISGFHLSTEAGLPPIPDFHLSTEVGLPPIPDFQLSYEAGLPPILGLHLSTEAGLPPIPGLMTSRICVRSLTQFLMIPLPKL
ncbi:hypothetical protein BUALT_Bualt08G0006100 [Buddleja alternifolia]|uniref:Tyrosinase copper-binding domain-containing protein n=1 Tax=Buddleja alternifolia TaxID=168488 RepID=A0AAV6XAP9_9LAMI|nr:hypothetical protein BUALT_Bualt08G0006100 [Buddleja alternifolia]